MTDFGYHASLEQFPPDELVDLVCIFGDGDSELVAGDPPEIDLRGYGYSWYRIGTVKA